MFDLQESITWYVQLQMLCCRIFYTIYVLMFYVFLLQKKSNKMAELRASERKINHQGGKTFALAAQLEAIKGVKAAHLNVVANRYKKNAPGLSVIKYIPLTYF